MRLQTATAQASQSLGSLAEQIPGATGVMRHEHVSHGKQIDRLAELTQQHQSPVDACNTWQALYAGTARLTEELIEHIHTENNLRFPMFEGQEQH